MVSRVYMAQGTRVELQAPIPPKLILISLKVCSVVSNDKHAENVKVLSKA